MDDPTVKLPNRAAKRGFQRKQRIYTLRFEGSVLEGLEIKMGSVPVGTMLQIAELASLAESFTPEGVQTMGMMFEMMADSVISWNLVDENENPVPADMEGIKTLELSDALLIIKEWMNAAAGVSGPLPQDSNGTRPLGEVSTLPMEPL